MENERGHGSGHGHHHHGAPDFEQMGAFLLSDERRKWQDPEKIVDIINAPSDGIVIDLGCGPGFFTIPLAARMTGNGSVIGIDASAKLLSICRQRLDAVEAKNAELIHLEVDESFPLMDNCTDFVLMANVLHDFYKPENILLETNRILRKGGRIVNLDWKKESQDYGPPFEIRFSPEKSSSLLEAAGFKLVSSPEVGIYHYCQIAVK